MAVSEQPTLLPLDQWASIMGIDPWEFNQVDRQAAHPTSVAAGCKNVFYQYAYQKDWLSREQISEAIATAEFELAQHLNYWAAPKYTVNEEKPYPRPKKRWLFGGAGTPRGLWKDVETKYRKVSSGGIFARTLIDADRAVTLTDEDGDGKDDTFTVTTASSIAAVADATEIGVYFSSTDRIGAVEEQWRLRPVEVSISGGVATITGHITLLVKPKLQRNITVIPAQPLADEAATYVTTLDIYRVYTDTTATTATPNQGTALWESVNCPPDCTSEFVGLCIGPRDPERGSVRLTFGDPAAWPQNREPDRVTMNYLSGEPLVNGQMERRMAQVVARLAVVFFPSVKCGCEYVDRIIDWWRGTPSQNPEDEGSRQIPVREIIESPWGPARGSWHAWQFVNGNEHKFATAYVT